MTNEEKYKTPKERTSAFLRWCDFKCCDDCEIGHIDGECHFNWLASESQEIDDD